MSQPIILYSHRFGPNPWKVAIVLEELGIPYTTKFVSAQEHKEPAYEAINPNGRTPSIHDPNASPPVTLWESNAIIMYLVSTYDTSHRLTYTTSPLSHEITQYLFFQASGQGPYFGQASWFNHMHPEVVESARKRYNEHVVRILSVLDKVLVGKEWLVGDKLTVADLSFVTWDAIIPWILGDEYAAFKIEETYPTYWAWREKLMSLPSVQKVMKAKQEAMAGN